MLSLWPSLTLCVFLLLFAIWWSLHFWCTFFDCRNMCQMHYLRLWKRFKRLSACFLPAFVYSSFSVKKIFREKINWFVFFVWCYFLLLDWGLFLVFFPRIVFIVSHDLEKIIWLPIICLELFPPSMNIIWNLTGWEGESVEWWVLISCISSEWV